MIFELLFGSVVLGGLNDLADAMDSERENLYDEIDYLRDRIEQLEEEKDRY